MKAYILHGIGDLRYEEINRPSPGPEEVLVEVKAAGICGSDISRIYKTGTYSFPLIPGHEFSGKVVGTGEEADRGWLGRRVGVFPLIPCRKCAPCRQMHYEMCRKYSYLGSRTDGGFAQYVVVPQWNLLELPENVSFEQAAMLEPMAVAVHAIRNMFLDVPHREGTVAVCGLGTIGILLAMFLREAGDTRILVIGNKDFHREMTVRLGIPGNCFCDSRKENISEWIMERTNGYGVSSFFECVGRNETIVTAAACTAPGGTVVLVGNPVSDICFDKNTYWKVLRNQLTVKGSWNSSYMHSAEDDWHYVMDRLKSGRIHPELYITHQYDLSELGKGLRIMQNKTEEYVKIMIFTETQ